ncbi:NUDIX domain-containing protein [Acidiphilium sp. PM]|uniref:NUDIX domain-containing protein n=1 Tax=Acidiphilium sp. PM TaxID=1043206 RepID=UPI000214552D|nr:NUDIX domain-containing protein [Acidiphilium sp. PM]EGO94213.1 NUDIX hydrolase [Acidiphilium sp. PM]
MPSDRPHNLADRVRLRAEALLAAGWGRLTKVTFDWRRSDGRWQTLTREVYDVGNGAAILLYDPARRTVILVRQFRYPAFAESGDGLVLEAIAGKLDAAHPEARIIAETEEETGYRIAGIRPVFSAYMSPGALTEKLFFFVARYTPADRVAPGGGCPEEGEDIETVELDIDDALRRIETGEIHDAKAIMLLHYAALHLFPPAAPRQEPSP